MPKKKCPRKTVPIAYNRTQSSVPKDWLMGTHDFSFEIESMKQSKHIFKVDIGSSSSCGNSLTAIKCYSPHHVEECFYKARNNDPEVFKPICAYQQNESYLLFGDFVGDVFEEWVAMNTRKLWTNAENVLDGTSNDLGYLTELSIRVGKQLCRLLINFHQKGKFLGNIREELCIKEDGTVVFLPDYSISNNVPTFEDGLKKDLQDLKWFINKIYEPFKAKSPNHEPCVLFADLYPNNLSYTYDEDLLKSISCLICYNPIFWEWQQRYKFAKIAKELYQLGRHFDEQQFEKYIPIGTNQVVTGSRGRWWKEVEKLSSNNILRRSYQNGLGDLGYVQKRGIMAFIRNTWEHYHQLDPTWTLHDIDNAIVGLFPNVYQKIYKVLASANSNIRLDLKLLEKMQSYD